MVKTRWHDKQFERNILDPAIVKYLDRIGIRGTTIAKQLISGGLGRPDLRAIDQSILKNSLAYEKDVPTLTVRIGTNVLYAIYVFVGTFKMRARPVLRTMLAMLRIELR